MNPSLKRLRGALIITLALVVAGPLNAQDFAFPETDLVAAAEAFGAAFPRPTDVPPVPETMPEPEGSAERVCVEVTRKTTFARSGEMVVGGRLDDLRSGANKVWWKPLNSSLDMTIRVTGVSLESPGIPIDFEIGPPTAPYANERPLRQIPEEAFFPGGATFATPGRWIAVGTSGSDWGCFVFDVPADDPDGIGDGG